MAEKVYDRPRILKLGVKAGMRVLLLAGVDDGLAAEAREMGAEVATAALAQASGSWDLVFLRLRDRGDLGTIAQARPLLRRDGALWLLRPKGSPDLSEREVMEAGLAAGLVDVKVVAFSESLSALKLVYRLRDR
jgi:hypothetical protein